MAESDSTPQRKPLSVRTRFEVFKRDEFTCQYCGRKSPEVVLEADHIVPVSAGGSNDEMNLVTSCWDCNRGKSDVALSALKTGEDPHDRAIEILERERQLEEYNIVLADERERRERIAWQLWAYWQTERGHTKDQDINSAPRPEIGWLKNALLQCPSEQIKTFMDMALDRGAWKNLAYVKACVRNWRYERQANQDMGRED